MAVGGMIVDAAVTSVTITASGNRNLRLVANGDVNMSIGADTTYGNFGVTTVEEGGTWNIAANKTLSFNGTAAGSFTIATGKTLNLTGAGTMAVSNTFTNNGTLNVNSNLTVGANLSRTGNVNVSSGSTMSVTGDVVFSNTISNEGTLSIGGALSVSDVSGLEAKGSTTYSDSIDTTSGNGYLLAELYLIKGAGTNTLTATTVKVAGVDVALTSDGTGVYFSQSNTSGAYYVNTGTLVYNTAGTPANDAAKDGTTSLVLAAGATLEMHSALNANATNGIIVAGTGTINLQTNATLANTSISSSGTDKATMTGDGNYVVNYTSTKASGSEQQELINATKVDFGSDWTGTVTLDGVTTNNSTLNNLNDFGNANSTVEFKGVNMSLTQGTETENVHLPNILLTNNGDTPAWTITTGNGNGVTTLAGDISGAGDIARTANAGGTQTFAFLGDVSAWMGTFSSSTNAASPTNLTFKGDATVINAGVNIANGTVTVNNANAVAVNSTIAGGVGVIYDGAGAKTVSGTNTYTGATTINAGTVTAGTAAAFGSSTVTVNDGTLDMNSQALSNNVTYVAGSLTGYDAYTGKVTMQNNLTLNDTYSASVDVTAAETTLTLTSTGTLNATTPLFEMKNLTGAGELTFDTDIFDNLKNGTYKVAAFDSVNGESTWTLDDFEFDLYDAGGDFTWEVIDGVLTLTVDAFVNDLYWENGDNVWNAANKNWSDEDDTTAYLEFKDDATVHFTNASDSITVGEDVVVKDFIVDNGNYDFDTDSNSITIKDEMNLDNNANVVISDGDNFDVTNSIITLTDANSSLTITTGDLDVKTLKNTGTVTVSDGNVTIKNAVGDKGGTLHVDNGTLSMGTGNNVFDELQVSGAVTGNTGKLTVGGTSEVGSLAGNGAVEVSTGGALKVNSGLVTSKLTGAGDLETTGDLTLGSASSIGNLAVGSGNLTMAGDLTMTGDLTANVITITTLNVSSPAISAGGDLIAPGGVDFKIDSATLLGLGLTDANPSYTLAEFGSNSGYDNDAVTLNGLKECLFGQNLYKIEVVGNDIVITRFSDTTENFYEDAIGLSPNGAAGGSLLDGAVNSFDPQGNAGTYADLAAVVGQMDNLIAAGSIGAADRLAAAVAGASVTSIGGALLNDVERQLKMVRNRTMSMGVDPSMQNELPQVNGWIMAEGNSQKLNADGNYAGYTFNNWGGSFGADVNVSDKLTLGGSVTAMYGDITTHSADVATGNLDMYYVSAFARYMTGRWSHSFVMTAGLADANLERTVTHGGGSYTTKGDTDGYGLGFLYEVGYTMPLNEEASACWQPVVNVALVHTQINGYTETGSDAALKVGDMTNTYAVIGAGARAEFVVGQSLYNRSSVLQLRAMAKADIGDRQVEADVQFNAGGRTSKVKGAEAGKIGAELGAGFIVPVGAYSGDLFIDAAVEFRSGMGSYNGTVGYRFSF